MSNDKTTRIRELNDQFRTTFAAGRVVITAGVEALDDATKAMVLTQVRNYSDFTEDNDPYGEHDFGSFEIDGQRFFWKIDYYDRSLEAGSEDPSDPAQTTRVMTIMLAEEY